MKGTLAGPLVEQVTQPGPTIGRRTVPASYSSAHSACNDYSTGSRCLLPTGAGLPHAVKGNQLRVRCAADLQVWWERIFHVRASIRCRILCSCSFADPLPPRNFIEWNFMLRGLAPSARAACLRVRGGKPSKIVDGLGSLRRKLHQQLGYGFLRNWSGTTECKFSCRWGIFFLLESWCSFGAGKGWGGVRRLSISVLHMLMMCTASYVNFESWCVGIFRSRLRDCVYVIQMITECQILEFVDLENQLCQFGWKVVCTSAVRRSGSVLCQMRRPTKVQIISSWHLMAS